MSEIEKQFFDTFGIKSKMGCTAYEELGEAKADLICNDYCPECDYLKEVCPQITDSILLNLILIINPYAPPVGDTMEEMKKQVLYWCTQYANKIKHQVQALFKENN